MLYLVATPIGNLKDFSFRGVEVLNNCDYILCEDTRHSGILLSHYGIKKPLKSFHQFNEKGREEGVIADLKAGQEIGLISDAGTPGICDPGEALVKRCRKEGIKVSAVPGPSAWVMALSLSTFSKEAIQFLGFLPKKTGDRQKMIGKMIFYAGTSICYEAPHRLLETLEELGSAKKVALMRELTKTFEECVEGTPEEVLHHFKAKEPKGEIVLLIEGRGDEAEEMQAEELVQALQKFGLSLAEAIKEASILKGVAKREIYRSIHK